jgi:hypothetical protein
MAQQQRERDAQLERERVAAVFAQQQVDMERRAFEERQRAIANHWAEVDSIVAGFDRLCRPPARDPIAEQVAMLEHELECQAASAAADAERSRSAKYLADQRAAVARRESGW